MPSARRSRDSLGPRSLLYDLTPLDTPTRTRGTGRYVHDLALGLAALPASELGDVRLFGLTHLDANGDHRITDDLASFAGSPELPRPTPRDHYHWAYARRLGLWRALRRLSPGAIHLGDPNATPMLTWLTPTKKIVTCHDMVPWVYPTRYLGWKDGGPLVGKAIELRRYRSADKVIAISECTQRDLARFAGLAEGAVALVHNGVDVARWSRPPARGLEDVLARHGLGARPFVLCVGAADWHKNPMGNIGSLAAARRAGVDLELAWAARLVDAQRDTVERLAREAGVSDAVRFLGFVDDDDLSVLFRAAVAHPLVSYYEGFGLTIVEAMAAGCPVVTTRGGSLAEVAGDAALTFAPDDHAAMGAALARLTTDAALRTTLVEKGRARATLFTREAQARATLRVYQDVLGAKSVKYDEAGGDPTAR